MMTAIYARTSATNPTKLAAQIERCRQAALGETAVFTDHAASGLDRERPGLNRMFEAATTGRLTTILVTRTHRLSRSDTHLGGILDWFEANGVLVLEVDINGDTSRANTDLPPLTVAPDYQPQRTVNGYEQPIAASMF